MSVLRLNRRCKTFRLSGERAVLQTSSSCCFTDKSLEPEKSNGPPSEIHESEFKIFEFSDGGSTPYLWCIGIQNGTFDRTNQSRACFQRQRCQINLILGVFFLRLRPLEFLELSLLARCSGAAQYPLYPPRVTGRASRSKTGPQELLIVD